MTSGPAAELSTRALVGSGYDDFWCWKGRYRVCKGGRGSKKSRTTALNLVTRMMAYPEANALVVRKVYRTLRDSCFAELKWAVARLGVGRWWEIRESAMDMCYRPTGQRIFLRGLDNAEKLASMSVDRGVLCWLWIEEAYELEREADFDLLDEGIRGELPEGLFKQLTLTFNPWSETHWLKRRFFERAQAEVLAMTSDYRCNEWLDAEDLALFQRMERENPRRYRVAGLGDWGQPDGLVYDNWETRAFDVTDEDFRRAHPRLESLFGLDFGYTNDPSALFCALADRASGEIFVFDELYERGLTNKRLYERIAGAGYAKERIVADGSEPRSIDELRELGLRRIVAARKGPDSVGYGIQFLQGYRIWIHPRCGHFLAEIGGYCWEQDMTGRSVNRPIDKNNHLMDAMRYAAEGLRRGELYSF